MSKESPETVAEVPSDLATNELPVESHDKLVEGTEHLSLVAEEHEKELALKEHDLPSPTEELMLQIAHLEKEKQTLADQVSELKSRVSSLEKENQHLRVQLTEHDREILRSPPLEVQKHAGQGSSTQSRKPSFIELDLCGEATKISDIRKQMEQWRGWQLDMRGWRNMGVGPQIVL